jgi:threonylcarbamoyladenosine tRNA methylthiotransferase MtaB
VEKVMKTVSFQTLGCKLNQYDTELLRESFDMSSAYRVVEPGEPADICIVNTCTVTAKTDRQSRNLIRRAARREPKPLIVVTGCFAETSPEEVAALRGVDMVIPNSTKRPDFERIFGITMGNSVRGFSHHTRAFVKIQEGCSNSCSYCIVSAARGAEKTRSSGDVYRETETLVQSGYKEIVLTGTDLGRYTDCAGCGLAALIEMLEGIDDLERIRLSSIHPDRVLKPLLDIYSRGTKLCPHIHLSVQSGDDRILSSMNRSYGREDCIRAVRSLLDVRPDMAIGADLIVGFPGEDDEAFQNSVDFVKESGIAYLHVFPFSVRRGTEAASMKDKVDPWTKKKRAALLREVGRASWLQYRERFLGGELRCLVESRRKDRMLVGLSDNYLHIRFDGNDTLANTMVSLQLTGVDESSNYGRLRGGREEPAE